MYSKREKEKREAILRIKIPKIDWDALKGSKPLSPNFKPPNSIRDNDSPQKCHICKAYYECNTQYKDRWYCYKHHP